MATYTKMLPLDNSLVKGLTKPTELQMFHKEFVKEIEKARDSVFIEICDELKKRVDHRMIANQYFRNIKTVTKEKLGVWLETVAHILDQYCIPWLQKAATLAEEAHNLRMKVADLKAENSDYQKQIIQLQNQLVEMQDKQLKSVAAAVKTEKKSYSSALQSTARSEIMQSYSTVVSAFAPKKLRVAEKSERGQCTIIHGLDEEFDEFLTAKVTRL